MKTIPHTTAVAPQNGEYQFITPKHAYYIKLRRGVIMDCAPVLRESYLDVHIKYLIAFLKKTQGSLEINSVIRSEDGN